MLRIYTAEEYIAGLKAQNIVIYPLLEDRIRESNKQGIVQGCFPQTGGLIPEGDFRYSAGYISQSTQTANLEYYQPNTRGNQTVSYEADTVPPEYNISIKLTLKEAVTIVEESLKRDDKILAVKLMKAISSSLPADLKVNG